MSETILVTGSSGFIGTYVCLALAERGDRVIAFDVVPPKPELAWLVEPVSDRIVNVEGGVDDWSQVLSAVLQHQPTRIAHAGGATNPPRLQRFPMVAVNVNIVGTANVFEAARLAGVRRVVYFSSIGVLPPHYRYEPIDADHPLITATEGPGSGFYGAAKLAGEALAYAYWDAFGLDILTIRPSAVYGFGMNWPIYIKPMVENAVAGAPTVFETGRDFPRDYTHVRDVAQLTARMLDAQPDTVNARIFYGATGRPLVTAGRVAEVVRALVPEAVCSIGQGFSDDDMLEIPDRAMLDVTPAVEQLGYEPRFGDIRAGVEEYIASLTRYAQHLAGA